MEYYELTEDELYERVQKEIEEERDELCAWFEADGENEFPLVTAKHYRFLKAYIIEEQDWREYVQHTRELLHTFYCIYLKLKEGHEKVNELTFDFDEYIEQQLKEADAVAATRVIEKLKTFDEQER